MTAVLRVHESAKERACRVIGAWPAARSRKGGTAHRHAREHWQECLRWAARQTGDDTAILLGFVGRLTAQVEGCRRCRHRTALDPVTPEEWVWWILHLRPTRAVIKAIGGQLAGRWPGTPKTPGQARIRPLPQRARRA